MSAPGLDISLVFNVVMTCLLITSEALPFIKSNDYNGLLQMLLSKLRKQESSDVKNIEQDGYDSAH